MLWVRRYQGLRLLWRGDCYAMLDEYSRAARSYDGAIALYQSLQQPQSVALHMADEAKALLLYRERRFAEAIPLLRLAVAGYRRDEYRPDGPGIAAAKVELAANLLAVRRAAEAGKLIAAAAPIVDRDLARTQRARLMLKHLRDSGFAPLW